MNTKPIIIYIDMDDCLCDFKSAYVEHKIKHPEIAYPQSAPEFFTGLVPLPGALEQTRWLADQDRFDVYILSAPSIHNPLCYTEKRLWIEEHLGFAFVNRLILSPHKNLNHGDYLIDDNASGKGQDLFTGKLIHFGSSEFPNWMAVRSYFDKINASSNTSFHRQVSHPDILAFRSMDMRDRFPEPVATFREALELIQSERAYLPEYSSNITCYLRDGRSITVPESFYIEEKQQFSSREAAETWVRERAKNKNTKGIAAVLGIGITNPKLPIEQQIEEAFQHTYSVVKEVSENEQICAQVDEWLYQAIESLPD